MAEIHTLKFGPQLLEDAEMETIRMSIEEAVRESIILVDRYQNKNPAVCSRLACMLGYLAQARREHEKMEGRP